MDISGGNDVYLPIYSVTSTPHNGCFTAHKQNYFFPRTAVAPGAIYTLPLNATAQDESQENVSAWLDAALQLVGQIAPSGAPVVATLQSITNSELAKKVKQKVNEDLSSKIDSVWGLAPIEIDQEAANGFVEKNINWRIEAVPYTTSFRRKEEQKPIALADWTLSKRWRRSAIAQESASSLDFGGVGLYSPIWVMDRASGHANQQPILNYVLSKIASVPLQIQRLKV
jgi:hypothetical protein